MSIILTRAPFRLPIAGGGTDLPAFYREHGGYLITAAIDKYMYITVNVPSTGDVYRIIYSRVETLSADGVDSIQHDIVREALKHHRIAAPIEISSVADLPARTGMGSSGAYTVALVQALNALRARYPQTAALAEEACVVEIDLLGKPIGKQDQYASACGGLIEMEIARDGVVRWSPLPIDASTVREMEHRLMMFYTGIRRDADTILAEQCDRIAASPRTADGATASAHGGTARDAMAGIKDIGRRVRAALLEGDVSSFGRMMHEHWELKKSVSGKMTTENIDSAYELARRNGALGGKIMGAGGGGFLLLCADADRREELRDAMEAHGLQHVPFAFDWKGSSILVDEHARVMAQEDAL